MTRLGEYQYHGNGELLENDIEYVFYETDDGIEAFPEGESEPVEMNRGTFASLERGNLERLEGYTPQG